MIVSKNWFRISLILAVVRPSLLMPLLLYSAYPSGNYARIPFLSSLRSLSGRPIVIFFLIFSISFWFWGVVPRNFYCYLFSISLYLSLCPSGKVKSISIGGEFNWLLLMILSQTLTSSWRTPLKTGHMVMMCWSSLSSSSSASLLWTHGTEME